MLKIIILLQIFNNNKIFTINKIENIESGNKLIEKLIRLKTRKLSKLRKLSKSQKLAKLKNNW